MTCAAIVCSASRLSPQHEPTLASAVAALLRAQSPAPASPPAASIARDCLGKGGGKLQSLRPCRGLGVAGVRLDGMHRKAQTFLRWS